MTSVAPFIAATRRRMFTPVALVVAASMILCAAAGASQVADPPAPDQGVDAPDQRAPMDEPNPGPVAEPESPPATAPPATAPPDEIVLRDYLVLAPFDRIGRAVLHKDPLEAQLATGQFQTPRENIQIAFSSDTVGSWVAATADDQGLLRHTAMRGGYAYATVPSPARRVMLLEATGHGMVYVHGEPRIGDPYANGWVRLPVELRQGDNEFLFNGVRGEIQARLVKPKSAALLETGDTTLPDMLEGEAGPWLGSVLVINASTETLRGATIAATPAGGEPLRTPVPPIAPLSVRKVAFSWRAEAQPGETGLDVHLALASSGFATLDEATVRVGVRRSDQLHKRTFASQIDGSVQYYAVLPAAESSGGQRPGIVLALHSAGVEAVDYLANYQAKPWAHIVAPNNRRKYGFDWEDWGRIDAMEALNAAQNSLENDSRRVYATGHAMGGHGALVLGVTHPDRFAAVGTSAAWNSFLSYGGVHHYEESTPITEVLQRGFGASDVLQLRHNLSSMGVYLLHGSDDSVVPVEEARNLRQQLATFHTDFAYHEQIGGGHTDGKETYDWPPMMEFLKSHTLPTRLEVKTVDFTTFNPGVASRSYWAEIQAQEKPLELSEISITQDPDERRLSGYTKNVARLALDVGQWPTPGTITVQLDGQTLGGIRWPSASHQIRLVRENDQWRPVGAQNEYRKGPHRNGTFKDAFRNHVLFVYGTQGTPEENAWALAKARFDAESFWYRGNGSIDVVADVDFDPAAEPDRNVVVYGNADTNAAWKDLLATGPIQLRRDGAMIEIRPETGDLGAVFIRPRPGSDTASVGVVGGTSLIGMQLTNRLRYFVSGVAFPDVLLVGPEFLTEGPAGVRMTGYFGPDWGVNSGDIAWRDAAL